MRSRARHAPPAPRIATRPAAAPGRHGVAFGLRISGDFEAPGLWTGTGMAATRRASLSIVSPATLARSWSEPESECLMRVKAGRDGPTLLVDAHPAHGYLVQASGFGAYQVAADGRRIRAAPAPVEAWLWQRLLTAQVLPIAALAQGLDLLHASAVSVDGRVLAFSGASGTGKTTLAARLVLAGATFVSDDVLALERTGDGLLAHPGPPLLNLRESGPRVFDADERDRLGVELGRDEAAARVRVLRRASPAPLHAIYLLRRSNARGGHVRIEPVRAHAAPQLLGAAFGTAIRTPVRLIRHLDLCAHLARSVPVIALEAPADMPADALAQAVLRHAGRDGS